MGSSYANELARANSQYDEEARKFDEAYHALYEIMDGLLDAAGEEDQYDNAADTGAAAAYIGSALSLLKNVRVPATKAKEDEDG